MHDLEEPGPHRGQMNVEQREGARWRLEHVRDGRAASVVRPEVVAVAGGPADGEAADHTQVAVRMSEPARAPQRIQVDVALLERCHVGPDLAQRRGQRGGRNRWSASDVGGHHPEVAGFVAMKQHARPRDPEPHHRAEQEKQRRPQGRQQPAPRGQRRRHQDQEGQPEDPAWREEQRGGHPPAVPERVNGPHGPQQGAEVRDDGDPQHQ